MRGENAHACEEVFHRDALQASKLGEWIEQIGSCKTLIEHFAGAFPVWLAPEQVRVLTVSEKFTEYAKTVEAKLRAAGVRATADLGPDKVGAKVRTAAMEKIPYMVVVGDKEVQAGTVTVRERGGADLGNMPLEDFLRRLDQENRERTLPKTAV